MTTSRDAHLEIAAANKEFEAAIKRRDSAAIAGLYTGDGVLLPPNSPLVQGQEAIRAFWQGILDLGVDEVRLESVSIEPQGNTAVEVGRGTIRLPDGAVADEVKYIVVWKDEGGSWKLRYDIWNSSRPAPA